MRRSAPLAQAAVSCLVAVSYGTLACVLTWPLPLYLRTRLLGDPAGDLGVYVWNVWIFRHELIRHGHLPFSTDHVFGATGAADFSLHNYAPIAGVLGAPLIGALGVVAAFNVVMLFAIAIAGFGTFLLARQLGLARSASWCAGALFMASPVLTARETAHFSLVLAAPLPLFLWALLRCLDFRRSRDALLVGTITALAAYADAYYGIYCCLMGAVVVSGRFLRVRRPSNPLPWQRATWATDLVLGVISLVVGARLVIGPSAIRLGPVTVGLHSLYTPLLLFVAVGTFRLWLPSRPWIGLCDRETRFRRLLQLGLLSVVTCLVLLSPELVGIALRVADGRLPDTPVFWRSSPRGLDLLAYVVPNPNHAWFGEYTRPWFMPQESDAFPEYISSFSLVTVGLVAVAAWRRMLPPLWTVFTGLFVWLSLGPFVHVAGLNTNMIGPWALLRYVPVIGMARAPARFAVVAALGMSLLTVFALTAFRQRSRRPAIWLAAAMIAATAFELVPAPRRLYSAEVPDIYRLVSAAATRDEVGRLLELPTGIRDGTSSLGDFSALSSFFQTSHHRPLIGGYLSRVSTKRKLENMRMPMLGALTTLSQGGSLSSDDAERATNARDEFLARSCTRFVLVNTRRASAELHEFARRTLRLTLVADAPDYALYTPEAPPPCTPPSLQRRLTDISWFWQPAE